MRNPTPTLKPDSYKWRGISHPPLVDVVTNRGRRIRNDGLFFLQSTNRLINFFNLSTFQLLNRHDTIFFK